MSVATRNPFALLDEDTRPSTPPPPTTTTTTTTHTPNPAQQSQQNRARGRGGPASRGGRYYQRGGAVLPPTTPPTDDQPSLDPKPRRFDGDRREGRARGRGLGRGRGRPFDKHSATGKTDSEKKVHNSWGGDDGETERKIEEAATDDAAAENLTSDGLNDWAAPSAQVSATDDWGNPPVPDLTTSVDPTEKPQSSDKRDRRPDREEEEEDNTLTLDQYNAQQRDKAIVAILDLRKPNDDVGDDLSLLQKVDDLEYYPGKQRSTNKHRDKDKKEQKVLVPIDLHFEPSARGGRGGRGGDRGGERGRGERGERGRGRGGRGRAVANGYSAPVVLNVDDQIAFPSLS